MADGSPCKINTRCFNIPTTCTVRRVVHSVGQVRERNDFPELDVRQSYRKDNMNEQKSVCSPGNILLPVGKLYNA